MTRALRIQPGKFPEEFDLPEGTMEQLEKLQGEVGGYVESVRLLPTLEGYGLVNEDGIALELPINDTASIMTRFSDLVRGTMIILGQPDANGDPTDVPDYMVAVAKAVFVSRGRALRNKIKEW
jgi:hypothetical protein